MRYLLFCLLLLNCTYSRRIVSTDLNASNADLLNNLLQKEVGSTYQQLPNESNTFLLAIREKATSEIQTKYVVVDLTTYKIVKKGMFRPGYLKWITNNSLELLSVPGIMPRGKNLADYTQVIPLKQQNN